LKKVIQLKFIYHLDENVPGFELPKIEISKHYNKLPTNIKTIPSLPHNNLKNLSPSREKLKTIKAKIENFNAKKQDIPITRDTHIVQKTQAYFVCASCAKIYHLAKCIERHLQEKHDLCDEKSKIISKYLVSSNFLTSAIQQQLFRKKRKNDYLSSLKSVEVPINETNSQIALEAYSELSLNEHCSSIEMEPNITNCCDGSNIFQSQNEHKIQHHIQSIQDQILSNHKKHNQRSDPCACCHQRRTAVKAPCKKCGRQCCLVKGGCSTHKFKVTMKESIKNFEVLALDFETTHLSCRSLTDCYILNLVTKHNVSFPNYIKPRVPISKVSVQL
jgi:hypothetical protein